MTGGIFADLLTYLPIYNVAFGTQVIHQVTNPYFLKCAKRYVPNITIYIRDLQGNPFQFLSGEVRVKLRFRPKHLVEK